MSSTNNGIEAKESGPSSLTSYPRTITFLGPEGTYGQQAAKQFARGGSIEAADEMDWIACPTITDAYERESLYTVLPLENTIFGPVTETLDCFFTRLSVDRATANDKKIIATLDLPIRHCLIVKKRTRMEDIRWVRSHEQALGQSAHFLAQHLPHARRIPTASTALAAQSLFTEPEVGAALCSSAVVESDDRLEVLHEGTQDRENNYTRFVLLKPFSLGADSPRPVAEGDRFYLVKDAKNIPALVEVEQRGGYELASIHSRPSSGTDKYPSSYFVELRMDPYSLEDRRRRLDDILGYVYLGEAPSQRATDAEICRGRQRSIGSVSSDLDDREELGP